MEQVTPSLNQRNVLAMMQRTFALTDTRMDGHGMRVSYIVYRMLKAQGVYGPGTIRDLCFVAMMHDIAAHKTDEINHIMRSECSGFFHHCVKGYLFLKYFSPFGAYADALLYHHTKWETLQNRRSESLLSCEFAQMISLADRADVYFQNHGQEEGQFLQEIRPLCPKYFSQKCADLFEKAALQGPLSGRLDQEEAFWSAAGQVPLKETELMHCIRTLVFSIAFRNQYTVLRTVATAGISVVLAELLQLDSAVRNDILLSAYLHDLGNVGIPMEILGHPGQLSFAAMQIVKTHVSITEQLLTGLVPERVLHMAVRHHERLDGSGYPKGLHAAQLTTADRIIAVADVASALLSTRSYREAYSREKVTRLLGQMAADGKLDQQIVQLAVAHFDRLLNQIDEVVLPVTTTYNAIQREYRQCVKDFGAVVPVKKPLLTAL